MKVGIENDNDNQVLIKDNWICKLEEVVIEGSEVKIVEKIKKARSKDKDVVRVVKEMKKAKVNELWKNKWQIERDLVLKEEKVYIPKNEELRAKIIQLHHNVLACQMWFTPGWKSTEMDSEMSGLVEQPWLQLMCCAVCLLHGCNFRCWEEV